MNFSSLSKAAVAASSVLNDVKAKASVLVNDAAETTEVFKKRAMEAVGVAEVDDDTLPELRNHLRLDGHLRKIYKHTDVYLRAVNAMCEASKVLADDFDEACESYPALASVASARDEELHRAMAAQMQVLGQMVHRKMFTPIRKEVEGRKEIEKRIADRKKVCADYTAYKRKQEGLIESDPGNTRMYEANLENARQTFARHSQLVANDLGAVAAERDQMFIEAFQAFVLAEGEFHRQVGAALAVDGASKAFGASHGPCADGWATVSKLHVFVKQQVQSEPPPVRSRHEAPARTAPAPAPTPAPVQARSPPAAAKSEYAPPDLDGFADFASAPAQPAARAPAPASSDDFDLLGGGFSSTPAPAANGASAHSTPDVSDGGVDLLGGMGGGSSASGMDLMGGGMGSGSNRGSSANLDLMGDIGGGSVADDLFNQLESAPALMPSMSAPMPARSSSAQQMPTQSRPAAAQRSQTMGTDLMGGGDPFADMLGGGGGMGGGGGGLDDLMGGGGMGGGSMGGGSMGGDLMGGDLMGGMMGDGGGASAAGRKAPSSGPKLNLSRRPGESDRDFFARKREAEKEAAIAEKTSALRNAKATEEANRDLEQTLNKSVKARVQAWQKEKKNLRALLASLHEIAPPCSWKPVTLGEVIDANAAKKAYRKALLAVHPDKQDGGDVEAKVLAQHIFDALRDAWNIFEKTG